MMLERSLQSLEQVIELSKLLMTNTTLMKVVSFCLNLHHDLTAVVVLLYCELVIFDFAS